MGAGGRRFKSCRPDFFIKKSVSMLNLRFTQKGISICTAHSSPTTCYKSCRPDFFIKKSVSMLNLRFTQKGISIYTAHSSPTTCYKSCRPDFSIKKSVCTLNLRFTQRAYQIAMLFLLTNLKQTLVAENYNDFIFLFFESNRNITKSIAATTIPKIFAAFRGKLNPIFSNAI